MEFRRCTMRAWEAYNCKFGSVSEFESATISVWRCTIEGLGVYQSLEEYNETLGGRRLKV